MDSVETISVLVVDESEAFLTSTRRWIESRPGLVLAGAARDTREALETAELAMPDVVIVEAFLAGTDGFRLARLLKQRKDPPLIVLVTFHASAAVRDEAYAAGADVFLAKYDFSDEIESILGQREVRTREKRARRESQTVPDP